MSSVRQVWLRLGFRESWPWIGLSDRIQGWLMPAEAHELFRLAKYHTPLQNARVVELGSWKGKSSLMLAAGLRDKTDARLFCIDPFSPATTDEEGKLVDEREPGDSRSRIQIFEQNLNDAGLRAIVEPVCGFSYDVAMEWQAPIDLLFIDAHHSYEAVIRDYTTWAAFVKPGGVVALHDANGMWPGPTRVVEEKLIHPDYGLVHRVKTLAWAIRRPA
jgi:MMP 1-O-methyltransferase